MLVTSPRPYQRHGAHEFDDALTPGEAEVDERLTVNGLLHLFEDAVADHRRFSSSEVLAGMRGVFL
jgi:hypothetical protein